MAPLHLHPFAPMSTCPPFHLPSTPLSTPFVQTISRRSRIPCSVVTPSLPQLLGWVSYCSIESFGSIGVANFWAFANSVYDLEGAKKSYGLLVACAQLGSICGPTLVTQAALIGAMGHISVHSRLHFLQSMLFLNLFFLSSPLAGWLADWLAVTSQVSPGSTCAAQDAWPSWLLWYSCTSSASEPRLPLLPPLPRKGRRKQTCSRVSASCGSACF